jgi:hypothetical protein
VRGREKEADRGAREAQKEKRRERELREKGRESGERNTMCKTRLCRL